MKSFKHILFIGVITTILSQCTISYSTNSGGNIPEDAKTFSVLYFQNNAPLSSGIASQSFTEALRDRFLNQTKLSIETEEGDLAFEGYIAEYKVTPIAIQSGTETAAQNRFTMAVKVTYINNLDEEKNFERTFSRFVDFPASREFNSIEEELLEELNEQLTQDIFNAAVGDW